VDRHIGVGDDITGCLEERAVANERCVGRQGHHAVALRIVSRPVPLLAERRRTHIFAVLVIRLDGAKQRDQRREIGLYHD
jgi:hypothetical protein